MSWDLGGGVHGGDKPTQKKTYKVNQGEAPHLCYFLAEFYRLTSSISPPNRPCLVVLSGKIRRSVPSGCFFSSLCVFVSTVSLWFDSGLWQTFLSILAFNASLPSLN